MKILKSLLLGTVLLWAGATQAQVSISVNIGSPPLWGPIGYTDVQYYYLPDVEAYYDLRSSQFIYLTAGEWVHRTYLPIRYRNYDLYNGYKVVMTDYRGNTPYVHFKDHKIKYAKGYHGQPQKSIGDKPGKAKQYGNTSSKDHSNKKDQGRGHGKGK
jgi:hypothetical protein